MVQVGKKTNDFPGILTLLADYYQRMNAIWIKLRGIMLYPLILLVCSLVLSLWIGVLNFAVSQQVIKPFNASRHWALGRAGLPAQADQKTSRNTLILQMFLPPAVMAAILLIGWGMAGAPRVRRTLRWHLPAFHEAHLAQFAAATELLLKSGCPLAEAVALLGSLERGSPMGKELVRWQALMAAGHGKIYDLAVGSAIIPPLFAWVVSSAGENLAVGFQRAAEIYRARAEFKTELLLYAALPCSILVMGLIILGQVYPLVINNYNLFQGIFRMSEILS
jgi:type II secretory pathway component PulF